MKMTVSMGAVGAPIATRSIGAILVDSGALAPEDAERVLEAQRDRGLRFGEAAVSLGLLTDEDVQYALARQFAYGYLRPSPETRPLSDDLIAAYQPFSPRVEQLRAIRSQLMLRWLDKNQNRQALAIVGAGRGEGRSWLAANLAIVFSQLGERTLLIDADMRTPRQHELFTLQNKVGLSTVLSGRARDEAIIRITDLSGLYLLPAGPKPPNPLELLSRLNFDEFLLHVRDSFDVVIVDTASLEHGDDAVMAAVRCGAAVAVARSGETDFAEFNNMVQGLLANRVSVVGSVLNDVPLTSAKGRS